MVTIRMGPDVCSRLDDLKRPFFAHLCLGRSNPVKPCQRQTLSNVKPCQTLWTSVLTKKNTGKMREVEGTLPTHWIRFVVVDGGGDFFGEFPHPHYRLSQLGRKGVIIIWVFPKIGVPQKEWFIMENPMNKWMIWGFFPLFLETSIWILKGQYLMVLIIDL